MKSKNIGPVADEVVTVGRCWRLSLRVLAIVAAAAAIICLTECFHVCAHRIEWLTANRN